MLKSLVGKKIRAGRVGELRAGVVPVVACLSVVGCVSGTVGVLITIDGVLSAGIGLVGAGERVGTRCTGSVWPF